MKVGVASGRVPMEIARRATRFALRRIECNEIAVSRNARSSPRTETEKDHAVPVRRMAMDLLEKEQYADLEGMRAYVNKMNHVVRITDVEHRRLSDKGLRYDMPKDWDDSDLYARYHVAEIEIDIIP